MIVSEVAAKLSMVMITWIGKSAREGMNTYFIDAMHDKYRFGRIAVALSLSIPISVFALSLMGILALLSGLVAGMMVLMTANKQLKGVTGDVFGTANDVSRMASLILIVSGITLPQVHGFWWV